MYYVYIIRSIKDGSYYVGHPDNFSRRLREHNNGKNQYTKSKRPWIMVYREEFGTKSMAMRREKEIKNKKRKSYIEWLVG